MARAIDADIFIRDLTAMKKMYDAIELDGMIKALKEAPTVEPKQEWISVRDRLPEKGKSVLVYWDDGFDIGEYVGGEVGYDVYWMPLPEPPERDDE